MNNSEIQSKVARALEGASRSYLEQIASHGIHNITNAFNGESEDEYEAFAAEFKQQATALLAD